MNNPLNLSAYRALATNSNNAEFRFWMNDQKGWVYPTRDGDHLLVVSHIVENDYPGAFIAEQWTRRLDKNGKKIFEGDLLTSRPLIEIHELPAETIFLVRMGDGCWKASRISEEGKPFSYFIYESDIKEWEIIGNIHEGITLEK